MKLWKCLFILLFLTTYFQKVGILDQVIKRQKQEVKDSLTEESKEGMMLEQEEVKDSLTEESKEGMKLEQDEIEESFTEESKEAMKFEQKMLEKNLLKGNPQMFQQNMTLLYINHTTSDLSATDEMDKQ